jgi:hypothetical protein
LRALKREVKMSREGKVKRKICVWKRKKEKWKVKKKMCVWGNEREWLKKKKRRRKKEEWQEKYERDESSERCIKCKEGCHVVERRNFHSFATMCNPTTRMSSVPRGHIFFCPCTCPPFYIFSSLISSHMDQFSWSLALKDKRPLGEVLSLTILVLIVLAIPIAPLYMLYERPMGGESFIKLV